MNKRYFVRYSIETPNALANRKEIEKGEHSIYKFNFGSNEIALYDYKNCLFSDCYVDAESMDKAEEASKGLVENILNLIDFSTASASASSLFISIYDAAPDLKDREFKQVFYVSMLDRNVSLIDKEIFGEIFKVSNKNKDERIIRAIAWLRKGYLEQKHIDKFTAFWTGLETINELLCDLFSVPQSERKMKCRKCGELIMPITIGIGKLFVDDMKIEKGLFDKIRRARGKLLHGGGPLDNSFVNEIKECNPTVRKALIMGIGRLLQMDGGVIKNIIEKKSKVYNERIRVILKANLVDFDPPPIEEFNRQPRNEVIDSRFLDRIVDEEGKVVVTINQKFKTNATMNKIRLEVWSEDSSSLEHGKFLDIQITPGKK